MIIHRSIATSKPTAAERSWTGHYLPGSQLSVVALAKLRCLMAKVMDMGSNEQKQEEARFT